MTATVTLDELAVALDVGPHEHVSLVGGGGKTTCLFALGRRLTGRVILTTTTKMGRDRTEGLPVLFSPDDSTLLAKLDDHGVVLVWGVDAGHKVLGVTPETCDRWFGIADHVVVEADGSRRRPFKAPRPFEPVVPTTTTLYVACVGADALGRVIADQCHRPLRVAALAGCSPYERLTPERLVRVLTSERGSRKNCPDGARFAVVISRVDGRVAADVDEIDELLGPAVPLVAVAASPGSDGGGR